MAGPAAYSHCPGLEHHLAQQTLSAGRRKCKALLVSSLGGCAVPDRRALRKLQRQANKAARQQRCSLASATATVAPPIAQRLVWAASAESGAGPRVAYQGFPGAYSEQAALLAYPDCQPVPCPQFEMVFQSLTQWQADRAVLPIENSLGGSIHDNLDLQLRYRLHIVGEVMVPISHCLMALPGVRKEELRRVISHTQALSQCDIYLRSLEGAAREAVSDTAGAAQSISQEGWRDVGALASSRAAEIYGLEILEEGVQDMQDNITRFIIMAREPLTITNPQPGTYKTSIVFSLEEGSGKLWTALSVFALRNIDMTKLESRPMRSNPIVASMDEDGGNLGRRYNYLFFVDFIGSTAEVKVQNALRNLQEVAPFLQVLGSYPRDMRL